MEQSVVVDDSGHTELSRHGQTGSDGRSQNAYAPAADRYQQNAEESGRIQIPGHAAKSDLFPDHQKDVQNKQDPAGSMYHEAYAPKADGFCQKPVKAHHGRLKDACQQYK